MTLVMDNVPLGQSRYDIVMDNVPLGQSHYDTCYAQCFIGRESL